MTTSILQTLCPNCGVNLRATDAYEMELEVECTNCGFNTLDAPDAFGVQGIDIWSALIEKGDPEEYERHESWKKVFNQAVSRF